MPPRSVVTEIAYTERVCEDSEEISRFLETQRVGILGLPADDYPYAVPVNYVYLDGSVYFHGMGSGRKVGMLEAEPKVCFTVYEEYGTVTAPMACHADTAYMSVMVFGTAHRVDDSGEAARALQALVDKLLPGYYRAPIADGLVERYRSSKDGNAVAVFRVTPDRLTAKANRADPEELFTSQA
nr:pyridoxamine 5'-phosphate oxidase family protein [Brooklawnia cerclae]